MNSDFHYYATYCAAILAGYTHEEGVVIATSDQLVDHCTRAFLGKINGPASAATTQQPVEMADTPTDLLGQQDITRIWASFHFLPRDLTAQPPRHCAKRYRDKYRLICGPNGPLLVETVKLARDKSLQAVGVAMHILADTWAHRYFAGTPSQVINNTTGYFYELVEEDGKEVRRKINFRHNALLPDDLDRSVYANSLHSQSEKSVMNLGHGRAGHLPDYSFVRYVYLPAWGGYEEVLKDNPTEYRFAFGQMIAAMKYLRGDREDFAAEQYDWDAMAPYEEEIREILTKRQLRAAQDWKALGERLSGQEIPAYNLERWEAEYLRAEEEHKNDTPLGRFLVAALAQKSMVTHAIYESGSKLAGYSIDYKEKGFRGLRDFAALLGQQKGGKKV